MQIKRFLIRFFFTAATILLCLYLTIIIFVPKFINSDNFKSSIEEEVQKQTGLITGIEEISIKPSLSPYINIYAHHIGLLYPNKKELLKIQDIEAKVRVFPILRKKIYLEKIIINRPILAFSIDKDGKCSLDKYLKMQFAPQSQIEGFSFANNVPNIEINRYRVKIYDKMYTEPFIIEGKKLLSEGILFKDGIKITTKGTISHAKEQYIKYDTETEVQIPQKTEQIFKQNPFRYIKKYQIHTNVFLRLKIKEKNKNVQITGSSELNDLNFKIENKTLANNHVNCLFENDKLEINADLKTNEKNNLQILGYYNFGKNKNIDLKVKAEKADLKALKNTVEPLLNALNIKNNLNDYNITGGINLNFKIKSDFKTLKSEGIAEIINANISSKLFQYSISKINSKINFANNTVRIEPSKMYINNTPVLISGDIDSKTNLNISVKSENLDAEKTAKIFLPKDIKQKASVKGNLSLDAKIKGTAKLPQTDINADFSNFAVLTKNTPVLKFANGKLHFTGTQDKPKGQIELKRVNILPEEFLYELNSSALTINILPEKIEIPKSTFTFGNAPFTAEGKITEYLSDEPKYDININGKLSSTALYLYLKRKGILKDISAATKGDITVIGKINGKGKNSSVKADIKADQDNYISGIVIRELLRKPSLTTIDASISDNNLHIKEIALNRQNNDGSLEKILYLNGKINNINNPVLENVKFIVPKSMTFSVSQLKNSEITINSNLTINGNQKSPDIKGKLNVKNIIIPEYKLQSYVNEIVFEDKNIRLLIPKLEIGNSSCGIFANIEPNLTGKFNIKYLSLTSDYLDLDELNETFSETQSNPVYPGIPVPIDVPLGKAVIKVFKTGNVQAEDVNCDISIKDNVLKMTNITGTAYKGSITGKSEYNFLHTSTISEIYGENADVRPLIKALTGKKDEMSGLIDYKIKLSTIGTKMTQQQRTAKGYIEFTARKGVMGPLGQFEHFLYAQNLISQSIMKLTTMAVIKAIRPQNTGLYTTASGTIEINKGNAYLKPLTVEGPNMSLYMTGKINVLNDIADLRIYGRISQQIEQFLGDLSNPVPQTIMTTSSETSIGNLFYDEYNTTIPKSITEAIPKLNPETGLNSRLFTVKIQGTPESVKAVKSFKWIVGTTNAPIPQTQDVEKQTEETTYGKNQTPTQNNALNNANHQQNSENENIENTTSPAVREKLQRTMPEFMDSLPDDFN